MAHVSCSCWKRFRQKVIAYRTLARFRLTCRRGLLCRAQDNCGNLAVTPAIHVRSDRPPRETVLQKTHLQALYPGCGSRSAANPREALLAAADVQCGDKAATDCSKVSDRASSFSRQQLLGCHLQSWRGALHRGELSGRCMGQLCAAWSAMLLA